MKTLLAAPLLSLALLGGALAPGSAAPEIPAPDLPHQRAPHAVTAFHPRPGDNPRLVEAWRTWRAQHDGRYTTVVRAQCFCAQRPPVVTDVAHGTVTSITYRGHDREIRGGFDVGALFRLLRQGYAEADSVHVRYGDDGVPRSLFIDWSRQVADEETGYAVRLR